MLPPPPPTKLLRAGGGRLCTSLVPTSTQAPRGVARPAVTQLEADARTLPRARAMGRDLSWPLPLARTPYSPPRRPPQSPRPLSSTPPLLAKLGRAAITMPGWSWRAPAAVGPPPDPLQLARVRRSHSIFMRAAQSPRGAAAVRIHLAGGRVATSHGAVAGLIRGPVVPPPPPNTRPSRGGVPTCQLGKAPSLERACGTLPVPPRREGTLVRRWSMRLRIVAVPLANGAPPTTPLPSSE